MTVTLPDAILRSAQITEAELKVELALTLFKEERLTLSQAAELAGITFLDFQRLLRDRRIPIHYDLENLNGDLRRALDASRVMLRR